MRVLIKKNHLSLLSEHTIAHLDCSAIWPVSTKDDTKSTNRPLEVVSCLINFVLAKSFRVILELTAEKVCVKFLTKLLPASLDAAEREQSVAAFKPTPCSSLLAWRLERGHKNFSQDSDAEPFVVAPRCFTCRDVSKLFDQLCVLRFGRGCSAQRKL